MRRVLVVLIVLFAACHLEPRQTTGPNYQVRQVFVVPDTVSIDPLGDVPFQAYGRTVSGDSVGVAVQWSASVGSITSDAVYTADTSETDATVVAQLDATSDAVPLVGTATVHKRRIVALLLSPSAVTLQPRGVQQFSTRAVNAGGDTVSIAPQYTATGGTITSGGLYTAGLVAGRFRVIASRKSGVFDTASVTIAQLPVSSVSLDPAAANVPVGGVSQLTATTWDATGNVLTGRVVTWSSDAPAVATVSGTGLVSGVAAGSATITATSEGQSGSAAISVVMVPVATVVVSPPTANLRVGTTSLLIATTEDGSGNVLSGRAITWSSDAPSIASVSVDGLVSALASGSATITATSEGQSGAASVTVSAVPVASVSVTPTSTSLRVGGAVQLSATTKDSVNNVLNGRAITWSSSAPTIATVSGTGLVSAVGAGAATITATSEGKSGAAAVTVTAVPVASVTVSPASSTLRVGATAQLSATTQDSAGNVLTGRVITWSINAPTVATVSAAGLVSAVSAGSAVITATSEGKSGTALLTVTVVPVATVTVAPATKTLGIGATVQLTTTTKDSAGNVLTGRSIAWSSNAPGVATVSASGLVTGVAVGSATITATSEGKSGTSAITVTVVPVASVTVAPTSKTLRIGTTAQLAATTKDSAGNVLTGRSIAWSSSAPAVATVSASGLVSGVAVGTATITATSEGKSGTAAITVTVVPVASVTVTPALASVNVGSTLQLTAVTKDSAGNVLTGRVLTWSSSATGTATVSASGLVAGVAAGSAIITATSEAKSGTSAITVQTTSGSHAGWYASPGGSSGGDGSSARPWNLQTALNGGGGKVQPGDTVWLRGGTYSGTFSGNLNGTAAAWIVVRQYPGERATLDGGTDPNDVLTVNGSYTMYWGFELMESGTQRFGTAGTGTGLRGDGVYVNGASNIKLINLIIHDTGHGTYTENTAHNIEIYGWIVYNGGYEDGTRSDGHGIYIKGDGIGWKIARDNVIFNQFGFGIHGYAETNTTLKNLIFDGNVAFNNGTPSDFDNPNMQLGGSTIADNDTVTNNMAYFSPGVSASNGNVRIGYSSTANGTAVFRNNYVVGGTQTLDVGYWSSLTVQGNTIVGPSKLVTQHDGNSSTTQRWSGDMHYRDPNATAWQLGSSSFTFSNWESRSGATDQASATMPSAPQVFVRPNRYEAGRAMVVVYNWTLQGSVPVDLSGIVAVGNRYAVRNVQDIFGTPVASGTYGGGTITVPMNGVTPPQPIGGAFKTLIKTGPNFDVFIVTSAP